MHFQWRQQRAFEIPLQLNLLSLVNCEDPTCKRLMGFSPFAFLTRRKSFCFSNKASYHQVSMHAEFFSLNYDIRYGSKTQKLVLFKFQLKQPQCSFMSFSVFGTAFPWKPVMLDISFNVINNLFCTFGLVFLYLFIVEHNAILTTTKNLEVSFDSDLVV